MCRRLIKSCEIGKHDVSSLKKVIFSGSTVNSEKVHIGLGELFPNASIFQAYSMFIYIYIYNYNEKLI